MPRILKPTAREQFAALVEEEGANHVARRLGVSRQHIYAIRKGARGPSALLARRIEDYIGIPMRAWTDGHA